MAQGVRLPLVAARTPYRFRHETILSHPDDETELIVSEPEPRRKSRACLALYNRIPQNSQALDLDFNHIAGLQEHRPLAPEADPGRRTCKNKLACFQCA